MSDYNRENISLKMHRVSLDLYQSELAKLADVAKVSVARIETGDNSNFRFHILLKICAAIAKEKGLSYKDVAKDVLGAMIDDFPDDPTWLDEYVGRK